MVKNSFLGIWLTNWLPAARSNEAMKSMNEKMDDWATLRSSVSILTEVVADINPVIS